MIDIGICLIIIIILLIILILSLYLLMIFVYNFVVESEIYKKLNSGERIIDDIKYLINS